MIHLPSLFSPKHFSSALLFLVVRLAYADIGLDAASSANGTSGVLHVATLAQESPAAQALLSQAYALEQDEKELDGLWQAANLYCQAARIGSAEASYRLGMLYAFGLGVPQSRALGAALFSLAAGQGHAEAQKMLETIAFSTSELPACVLDAVTPEPGFVKQIKVERPNGAIDAHLQGLPANKLWIVDLVKTVASWYQVDPKLVLSVIAVESNFKTQATSAKSAMGLMQLIPATAERFNIKNAYEATQNIKGGIAYLRWLLSYFRGDVALAIAGYNAGERAVDRHKGIPPYTETRQYVKKVLLLYGQNYHSFDFSLTNPSPLMQSP